MNNNWKLFLDDERYPNTNDWVLSRNFDDSCWYIKNYGLPYHIAFDYDLGHPKNQTGLDFAKWFCNYLIDNDLLDHMKIFTYSVHSQNPIGAKAIRNCFNDFQKAIADGML